jgi:transcription antitermination factor NusG
MTLCSSAEDIISLAPWYAIQVKGSHEKRVASMLGYNRFDWFLPLYESSRRWSDRIKRTQLPLFPGYVFCRFAPAQRVPILKTPSVIRIVGIGHAPIPIPEQEMAAIQTIAKSGFCVTPHPFLTVGQRVWIKGGPLHGLKGLITDLHRRGRVILSVTLLQRSVAVEIDSAWVIPLPRSATP